MQKQQQDLRTERFPVLKTRSICSLAVAGGLTTLAFAPYRVAWLVFFSIAWLLQCCLHASRKRDAFRHGWIFGLAFFGTGVYWVSISLSRFIPIGAAWVVTALLIAFLALFPAMTMFLLAMVPKNRRFLASWLVFPTAWILTEWLRSHFLLGGFSWLLLGYTQTDTIIGKVATLGSVYAVSFVICLISVGLVGLCRGNNKQRFFSLAMLGLLGIGISLIKPWSPTEGKTLTVSLVQGNIPIQEKWQFRRLPHILAHYKKLTQAQFGRDLIVWPESALPAPAHRLSSYLHALDRQARHHRTHLLMGSITRAPKGKGYENSLLLLGPTHGVYHKSHLVPFGEYIPLKASLHRLLKYWQMPMDDLVAGPTYPPPLHLKGGIQAIPFICYEISYPYAVTKRLVTTPPSPLAPTLIIVVTDDAWFGQSSASAQHVQIAQMRAIETGRTLLFASNTSGTAIIHANGRIITQAPSHQPFVLTGKAIAYTGQLTPWSRWVNWLSQQRTLKGKRHANTRY